MSSNGNSSKQNLGSNFDDELSDLFGELGGDTDPDSTGEPSESLADELSDLFGADINPQATVPSIDNNLEQLLETQKEEEEDPTPALPDIAAAELTPESFDALFGDEGNSEPEGIDLDFARMTLTPEMEPPASEAEIESELDTLFGENNAADEEADENLDIFAETSEPETAEVVSGLESLFANSPSVEVEQELEADLDQYFSSRSTFPGEPSSSPAEPVAPEEPTPTPEPISVAPTTTYKPAIATYPDLDSLAAFIDQPATNPAANWQDLTMLVEGSQKTISPPESAVAAAIAAVPKKLSKEDIASARDTNFDDLVELLEKADIEMGGPPTVSTAPTAGRARQPKPKAFEQTMRIPVKQLDNLSNLMGELVVNRNSLEESQEKLRQFLDSLVGQVQRLSDIGGRMQDLYERSLLERSLLASRNQNDHRSNHRPNNSIDAKSTFSGSNGQDYDPLEMDQFTGFHLLSQEMIELIVRVRESSSDIEFLVDDTEQVARNLRQVSTQLQEGLTKSRMIPFSQAADRLMRPVRDISNKLHKKAVLDVEGRDALIDKMILEQLYDPLTHLINNAITHGIERPDVRTRLGKSPTGKISLKAFVQGNQIVIAISDDGAGIDPEVIVRKALEKRLTTPDQVRNMPQQKIYDFIFHPGFTTKDKADDFAGRGVGMDVVRTALGAIRGTITIDSVMGRGTNFTIRLPLTLNICKALCCLNRHARIALPMDGVEDMQDFTPDRIEVQEERKYITWRNSRLRLHPLNNLLTHQRRLTRGSIYGGAADPDQIPVVILRSAGNLLALQVDQVIGEQEIVIKQIEGPIPKPAGISGATVLGDGTIMPVADVLELLELAAQGRVRKSSSWQQEAQPFHEEAQGFATEPMVLIVDDSITVRELLSISFTKAGYRVEQARDGQEAWEKLRGGLPCDLVFCDIEMPRIDGLELLSRIQKDENLAKIPVAMLTSRGADRHRQMAAQLGASAYFTKPYLEEALLDAALKMREGEVLLPGSTRPANVMVQEPELELSELMSQSSLPGLPVEEPMPNVEESYYTAPPSQAVYNDFGTQATFKVLIIDDSVTVRELLAITFQNAGYMVEKARDGQDALDKLLANPDFNVAFCDIEMPRIDGLELLNRVQEHEGLQHIPIAMLTSRGAERHRKIAADRGAKAYFTKPYVEDNLLKAAERLIRGEVLLDENGKVVG
ncbi:putative CheA signal transduction histidine kinase [[Leptolyngbya] sp. PCC 7376]|uniref:hybrid sensor histidine kinase/response regulator n=1 Tax=[Leptolyngbya] sp. PCC 7376 TaxID=111781 RepID=UPI00029F2094|nr:response regulator [[Leptolyngbya] sp. PCC 7376]AFY37474.1 putative CheA signal transduction histidine kinase [[Leptolyngbya] sp. PCC 7376]